MGLHGGEVARLSKKRFSASRKGACAVRGANGEGSHNGKRSRTDFKVIERFQQASLLEVKPISGRTHQIRVHVQHVGHPILGESKYLSDKSEALTQSIGLKRLFLHAKSISFELSGEHYELNCPIDKELESVLARLRGAR